MKYILNEYKKYKKNIKTRRVGKIEDKNNEK